MTSPGVAFLVTCWGTEPHLTNVDEEMVSTGKHFDKFVYREREKDATAAGEKKENREVCFFCFCFNWRNVKGLKAIGKGRA